MSGVNNQRKKRWESAQRAEKKFWKTSKFAIKGSKQHWERVLLDRFNIDFEFFRNKDVLEVGAGPSGMIYIIDEARYRIGVEPMDLKGIMDEWKMKYVIKG